jgi:hypothetical protein
VSPDSLVPNMSVRQAVDKFRKESGYTHHAASRRPPQPSAMTETSSFGHTPLPSGDQPPVVVERVRIGLPPLGSVQHKPMSTALPTVLSSLMSQTGVVKPQSPATYQQQPELVEQQNTYRQPPTTFHQQTLSTLESEAAAQASATPPHHVRPVESGGASVSADMAAIMGITSVEGATLPPFMLASSSIGLPPFSHSSTLDIANRYVCVITHCSYSK